MIKLTLRHFWNSVQKKCDCGNETRIFILGHWVCSVKLKEILEKQGFRLELINTDQNVNFDQARNLI